MENKSKKLRLCLVASAGGHLTELLKLSACWKGYETFTITTTEVVRANLEKYGNVYTVGECNRRHPLRMMNVLFRCIKLVFQERPDVVISTGAAVGCITCYVGKLLGTKVVWIDSITNVERISLSGRMVRYVADLFLVQWLELAERYKGAEYVGAIV